MSPTRPQFRLPDPTEHPQLLSTLKERFPLVETPTQHWKYRYYDTFDSRLYLKKQVLRQEERLDEEPESWLSWQTLQGQQVLHRGRVTPLPQVVPHLPSTPLRPLLAELLHPRALLTLCELDVEQHWLVWENRDNKTVLRLLLETSHYRAEPTSPPVLLDQRLVLLPFRGYPKPSQQVLALCREQKLEALTDDLLHVAAPRLSLRLGTYNAKPKVKLEAEQRTDDALRTILRESTRIMDANHQGTLEAPDTEFLHDFRVACRRARSALIQLKGVFPAEQIEIFRKDFSWLSDRTGPTRDLDVYLLQFNELQGRVPEEQQPALEPFRTLLAQQQEEQQRLLAADLQSERYLNFRQRWEGFLNDSAPSPTKWGGLPVRQTAAKRLLRSYHRCLAEGQAITPESPDEMLHELRKSCKKLRYLLEFFASLWQEKELQSILKPLKVLQENLGQFNDCSVQQLSLQHYSELLAKQQPVPAQTLIAMGMLVSALHQRQAVAREGFEQSFAEFASNRYQQRCQRLFRPPTSTESV